MSDIFYGGIEAGGTKMVCAVGRGRRVEQRVSMPTTAPDECIPQICQLFLDWKTRYGLQGIGLGMFGPLFLQSGHSRDGEVIASPKLDWNGHNLAAVLRLATGLPVIVESDVGVAAIGEGHWGSGRGIADFIYVTVGTGVGAAVVHHGELFRGGAGLELGHSYVPMPAGANDGHCPYHGACLEGLVSGPALRARWGVAPEHLPADHLGWEPVADSLAHALATWSFCFSPRRIILGGGLGSRHDLLERLRLRLPGLLGGYGAYSTADFDAGDYLVSPALGADSSVIGAFELAASKCPVST